MRTTLAIDDDVLAVVRERAARQHQSVGAVLSALAREALHPVSPHSTTRNGLALLPVQPGATPVTLEAVNQLRDEFPG